VIKGRDVLIAGRVYISDHDHDYRDKQNCARRNDKLISKAVSIGDGAWLGEGCVVLKGVSIGERSVIGANSVVTKDVPAWSVACGVPAKVIKKIDAGGGGG
jgi:acetyltransferase-like isoleucine patch superfamily enzyme